MWVTDSGMVKFANNLQFRKAQLLMWTTESGMVKFARELQPSKA